MEAEAKWAKKGAVKSQEKRGYGVAMVRVHGVNKKVFMILLAVEYMQKINITRRFGEAACLVDHECAYLNVHFTTPCYTDSPTSPREN
jgi:hypothetical protein